MGDRFSKTIFVSWVRDHINRNCILNTVNRENVRRLLHLCHLGRCSWKRDWQKKEGHRASQPHHLKPFWLAGSLAAAVTQPVWHYVREAHILLFLVVPRKGICKHIACALVIVTLAQGDSIWVIILRIASVIQHLLHCSKCFTWWTEMRPPQHICEVDIIVTTSAFYRQESEAKSNWV